MTDWTGTGQALSIPASGLLTTREAVRTYSKAGTGTFSDEEVDQAVAWASAEIESYCDRTFALHTVEETLEADGSRITLSEYPLVSLTSLVGEDGTAINTRLVKSSGTVLLECPVMGLVTATYQAGYAEIPAALGAIATELAVMILKSSSINLALRSEEFDDYSYSVRSDIKSLFESFTDRLAPYRRIEL